jgi:hypothetical protein
MPDPAEPQSHATENPYAAPAKHAEQKAVVHGDRALEHLRMERGRYDAWAYVVIAFAAEAFLLALAIYLPFRSVAETLALAPDLQQALPLVVGGLFGSVGAYFVFRDRWRCTEAFASNFCIGIANISVLYVPIVALVYANVRGVKKLFGA